MIDSELLPRVAKKIRTLRSNKNLTLADLSKSSNVSKGLLSKIENSRTIPSLPVFLGIVNALDISLKDFFEGMDLLRGKDFLVIRASDLQTTYKEEREGFSYKFIMAQNMAGSSMEISLLTIQPEAKSKMITENGFELDYIISGACDYYINEEVVRLEKGDTLYFDSSKAHMSVNQNTAAAVVLILYFRN